VHARKDTDLRRVQESIVRLLPDADAITDAVVEEIDVTETGQVVRTPVAGGPRTGVGRSIGSLLLGIALVGWVVFWFVLVAGDDCSVDGLSYICVGGGVETTINLLVAVVSVVLGLVALVGGGLGIWRSLAGRRGAER
jgi:hypothetical protein